MRPTATMWADIKERDWDQCAGCTSPYGLSHQHRRAVGMGGTTERPTFEDSLVQCMPCNSAAEHVSQIRALATGLKVRRWVKDPSLVPVFYAYTIGWARLTKGGHAEPIHAVEATEMMRDVYGAEWDKWCREAGITPAERR